jgi:hypothetical protein
MGNDKKLKQPNIELVKGFLEKEDAAMYNFRLQYLELTKLNDKNIPIINFKYYKQEYRKAIKNMKFDADCCELTMSIWCLLLKQAGFKVLGYEGRIIKYKPAEEKSSEANVEVETDTINSLERDLNKFVRKVVKRRFEKTWKDLYTSGSKIINGKLVKGIYDERYRETSEYNRDWWLIDNYEELFDERFLTASEIINLSALNELAKRVHTVGNFMIGPMGFNFADKKRAKCCKKFEDRLDKFMIKVLSCEDYEDWRQWFIQASPVLHIDGYFEHDKFCENTRVSDIKCLRNGDISEWSNQVCTLIENRSNIIIDRLKEIPKLK